MKLKLNADQTAALKRFLEASEDAEALSAKEYVADLYDIERPVTMNLVFLKSGVAVDGAAELRFDEEQDGWYMADPLTAEEVQAALEAAGAFGA